MTLDTLTADRLRLRRVEELIGRHLHRPVAGLRILDLACRTGGFAVPLARAGATVHGIEGQPGNLDQARHAAAGLAGLTLELGDVRDLGQRHGTFDVTLCLGILYHLDAGSAWRLLCQLAAATTGLCVIDTHVAGHSDREWTLGEMHVTGRAHGERPGDPLGAIGNTESAWFDLESLLTLVRPAGFGTVRQVDGAAYPGEPPDRVWLAATP